MTTLILKGDERLERYRSDVMMCGDPDAVLVARDVQEIREALQACYRKNIPVTFCGSQTSMTGASVAEKGWLISTEKMERLLDIHGGLATVQPGMIVGDLKRAVAHEGWFYPPAPTSQDEARIGATISTNATGEDSFQYGSTRKYVREIKVLLADGTEKVFSRKRDEPSLDAWNRGGYLLESNNPIDWFIGGEGTLGFIYEATVDLIPQPSDFFSVLIPFPSNEEAIAFAVACIRERRKLRALELIDTEALAYMKTHPTFPTTLSQTNALIYLKCEPAMSDWLGALPQAEQILVATSEKQKEEMRHWRHHIPLKVNEEYRQYWRQGGGKVGSDWWVPVQKLREMMAYVYQTGRELGVPFMAYAHIGRGHPHVNYLCKTAEEKIRAEALLVACCRKAVALGGGVAGEHGIGKLHRNLMPIQWSAAKLAQMHKIKETFDPKWLLGRGNIFSPVDGKHSAG